MFVNKYLAIAAVALLSLRAAAQTHQRATLKTITGFSSVPDSIQTSVYWYWISDNISKQGVVADLKAMKKIGINRAFIGNVGFPADQIPYGKVKLFSDAWWDILHTAFKTAGELDIQIGLFNGPGWSQSGGPWIKPEQSMRYLTSSQLRVKGGKLINVVLPKPCSQFQDQRVIAYPAPASSNAAKSKLTAQPALGDVVRLLMPGNTKRVLLAKGGHQQLDLTFDADYPAQSLTIYPARQRVFARAIIQAYQNGTYKTIKTFNIDRQNDALNVGFDPYAPVVVSFSEVKAKRYRLVFDKYSAESGIAGIELSNTPRVERYPEKTLAKMFPTPLPLWQEYQWPAQPVVPNRAQVIDPTKVMDITSKMEANGKLHWQAPAGDWVIMRTGMTSTRVTNSPATAEGTGLEVDKMSKEHVAHHFNSFVGEILKRIPAEDRRTWKVVVEDSYETGGQNWTDDFIADFKRTYRYDPTAYLPVFTGVVVGSQDQSDRFLWDVRRLIADNVAFKYVGGLREISHQHGLTTWLENYGHWGFPGEFLQYGGQSDEIGGEFWSEGELGNIENRAASSAAHIYGKTKVSAESFTAAGSPFGRYPYLMKQRGDRFFAEGINNTLLHVYIQQPYDDKLPGVNAWFGNEFNRHNIWFYAMDGFIKYLKRTNYLLQQGLYAADVAYFIGEDAPKMTGVQDPALPAGYSFDYINGEVIQNRLTVRDGRFTLPDGMSYTVLVLPKLETMRPEMLAKIADLVKQGGVVFGPRPLRSPSLQGYPEADGKLQRLANVVWGNETSGTFVRAYGKGVVMNGPDLQAALDYVNVGPDVRLSADSVAFLHRRLTDGDIYFISNQSSKRIFIDPAFRVAGKVPELWNAISGTKRALPQYIVKNGYTTVPLQLNVYESAFVVFNLAEKAPPVPGASNFPSPEKVVPLSCAWSVQFEAAKRGPVKPVIFNTLNSWTESANDSVKYYAGSASYTQTFDMDSVRGSRRVFVDLGRLTALARVKVNGIDVGNIWTPPYRLDITKALHNGQNTIDINVTNNWMNRLIGDSRLPAEQRPTWTSVNPFKPDSTLQPSGLFGPVVLNVYSQ